ncbi:hypothetical protein SJAG_04860 [Schizosaccharomyces japonicus yFS275]|uniref:MIT domain-containing protein n=1 Tax=Schizosaccharomyces japonicus (strain yFS275 / FY16936) TaxID=402676 RepID=B6K7Y7_SCHJY|nr:hypothetical protein SJAG_04860 [Schizosaccharomyces japonicus yFS275]EEB09641.1 hypothetical protein SJAG_04860 [Schizosaccharomyces japonicus yFS275]
MSKSYLNKAHSYVRDGEKAELAGNLLQASKFYILAQGLFRKAYSATHSAIARESLLLLEQEFSERSQHMKSLYKASSSASEGNKSNYSLTASSSMCMSLRLSPLLASSLSNRYPVSLGTHTESMKSTSASCTDRLEPADQVPERQRQKYVSFQSRVERMSVVVGLPVAYAVTSVESNSTSPSNSPSSDESFLIVDPHDMDVDNAYVNGTLNIPPHISPLESESKPGNQYPRGDTGSLSNEFLQEDTVTIHDSYESPAPFHHPTPEESKSKHISKLRFSRPRLSLSFFRSSSRLRRNNVPKPLNVESTIEKAQSSTDLTAVHDSRQKIEDLEHQVHILQNQLQKLKRTQS